MHLLELTLQIYPPTPSILTKSMKFTPLFLHHALDMHLKDYLLNSFLDFFKGPHPTTTTIIKIKDYDAWWLNATSIVQVYFASGIFCMVILASFEGSSRAAFLSSLVRHGRGYKVEESKGRDVFRVSKSLFWHFYLVSTGIGLWLLTSSSSSSSSASDKMVKVLFLLHSLRRLYENLAWFRYTTSMHLIHYLVGLSFYPIVWLMIVSSSTTSGTFKWALGILCFLLSSLLQSIHHFKLSRKIHPNLSYMGIKLLACPHYALEICIYASMNLLILSASLPSILCFLFVFINLYISASQRQ